MHAGCGLAQLQLGRYEEAITSLTEAIEFGLATTQMYRERGRWRLNVDGGREEVTRAADLEIARKGDPEVSETHFLIGVGRMQCDDPNLAASAFSEAIKLDPQLAEAYYRRGRCYETGTRASNRVYWSNKNTSIMSDLPSEAMLQPKLWGLFRFE